MSHLKYGLDHLGSRRVTPGAARAFAQIPLALLLASPAFYAQAELYFNPRFLADDPAAVADLSGFEKGQELPPGTYARISTSMTGIWPPAILPLILMKKATDWHPA